MSWDLIQDYIMDEINASLKVAIKSKVAAVTFEEKVEFSITYDLENRTITVHPFRDLDTILEVIPIPPIPEPGSLSCLQGGELSHTQDGELSEP